MGYFHFSTFSAIQDFLSSFIACSTRCRFLSLSRGTFYELSENLLTSHSGLCQSFQKVLLSLLFCHCSVCLYRIIFLIDIFISTFFTFEVFIHLTFFVSLSSTTGPILESKGMHAIFSKKGAKYLKIWTKINLKVFWKRAASCVELSHAWNS